MATHRTLRSFSKALATQSQQGPAIARLRVGTVTAISGGTVTLKLSGDDGSGTIQTLEADGSVKTTALGGSGTAVAGVSRYDTYIPTVGDVVDVLQVGGTLRVLGQLSTTDDLSWKALTLAGGFVSRGIGLAPPGYWRDPTSVVHLRGGLTGPATAITANTTIFTLPAGYRPPYDAVFNLMCSANTNATVTQSTQLYVTASTGVCQLRPPYPAASTWVSLEGVTFRTS